MIQQLYVLLNAHHNKYRYCVIMQIYYNITDYIPYGVIFNLHHLFYNWNFYLFFTYFA